MRPVDASPELQGMLGVLKVVLLMITSGLVFFLGYGAWKYLGPDAEAETPETTILTYACLGAAALAVIVTSFLRMGMVRGALDVFSDKDVAPFKQKYMGAVIVGAAGFEGAGFIAGVAYFLEAALPALGVGAACVLLLLMSIPTRGSLDNLIDSRP